jgi:hypothetical protein
MLDLRKYTAASKSVLKQDNDNHAITIDDRNPH